MIGVSQINYGPFFRNGMKAARIAILHGALDEGLATIEPASAGPRQSLANGPFLVLTILHMIASEQSKGHNLILRAFYPASSRSPISLSL